MKPKHLHRKLNGVYVLYQQLIYIYVQIIFMFHQMILKKQVIDIFYRKIFLKNLLLFRIFVHKLLVIYTVLVHQIIHK